MKKTIFSLTLIFFAAAFSFAQGSGVSGTVKDQNGDVVSGARVTLKRTDSGADLTTVTDREGAFEFRGLTAGTYKLRVVADGFALAEQEVQPGQSAAVSLSVGEARVTVSAEIGTIEETRNVVQAVNTIRSEAILQRVTSVTAQAAKEEVGLNYQRTSPTIGAIVIRGLTGKNVVNYVDGVRYTHGGQRGGINTFFNMNDASTLQAIEVVRGSNGSQYGSDSLAGTVNLISRSPAYGFDKPEWHGDVNGTGGVSDRSFGGSALVSYGTRRFGGYINAYGRAVGDVRTANGIDSRSAITRFLGLSSRVLYTRNPYTSFDQYGFSARTNWAPRDDQELSFFYHRSQQDNGKRFDQLLGGDGNLIADLRNLMLDFGYVRYVKTGVGVFDSLSMTGSFNSQREERVNQGGQGNPVGDITHQYERTSTYGVSGFVDKRFRSNTLLFGGDFYSERVNAPAYTTNGSTFVSTLSRPRVPDEASFKYGGVFFQDQWNAIPDRLRITGAIRYSKMSYNVDGANSPVVAGRQLFLSDSLSTGGFAGRIGTVARVVDNFSLVFNYGRGFRYPNITDLGTLGLTGDGFEVDHITAAQYGGTIGTTANASAVSTGIPVTKQKSEVSNSFDAGARFNSRRISANFTFFRLDINDAIVKQTLILPAGAVGKLLGSDVIASQNANGAVFVAASANPVLARVNFSDAKLWGTEFEMTARLTDRLVLRGNHTYIKAEDKATGIPPNIEGGTPPATGFLSLRHDWSRLWVEGYATLAGSQDRFSTGDLADRRTGAARSRAQIQNYFRRGACVNGLTTPGAGGCGTAGGILKATGETLLQVQNRLLPIGSMINGVLVVNDNTSVPLYTRLPGYGLVNVRGGFTLRENMTFFVAFENILDQFHRNPSWGIDGTGRNFVGGLRWKF